MINKFDVPTGSRANIYKHYLEKEIELSAVYKENVFAMSILNTPVNYEM